VGIGGPGAYVTQEHVSRRILEEAGYRDQASLHNPFDPLGLALSTILPGAFGALHMRGLKQSAPQLADVVQQIESGGRRYGADGNVLTSPKGAQGEMQVMPGTATDPGFGVTPAKDASPEELARVGRDYLGAMVNKYGDQDKALAAYNAGPGRVDAAIKAHGDDWLKHMPDETQKYVSKAQQMAPVEAFVDRMTRERLTSPEDLQFYQNNAAAVEAAVMRKLAERGATDPAAVDAARVSVLNETTARSLPDTPDAMAQVQRAADIVGESGGRAAESAIPEPMFSLWHGSPHELVAFDPSKIGTGEGHQAYGHGFYLAEARGVAETYSESNLMLSPRARMVLDDAGGDVKKAAALADQRAATQPEFRAAADELASVKPGNIYEVQIPISAKDRMLDWDKPLGEQTPAVRAAVERAGYTPPDPAMTMGEFISGKQREGFAPYLADDLSNAGIPGVKYLDQMSRSGGEGSRNYVVFPGNERLLRIASRNDAPLAREGSNTLPDSASVGLADAPIARPKESAAKPEQSADHAIAERIAAEKPDMLVTLPGTEERIPIAQALERIAQEQKQDAQWADLLKVAADCALGG
jgi:hypothetical protein